MKRTVSIICTVAMLLSILSVSVFSVVAAAQRWFTEKEPVTDYAYSFCFVPDTQIITERDPSNLKCIYDWIVANAEEKKMKFVFGLGDITNSDTDTEWMVAKNEIAKLDGVVPYSLIRGNHDTAAQMNKYFAGNKAYTDQFEGFFKRGSVTDSWRTLEIGDVKYLLITLDFGASDYTLKWAENVIKQHPDHLVIITTHGYMDDGIASGAQGDGMGTKPNLLDANNKYSPTKYGFHNNGDDMWNELFKKYENIFMVVCGHMSSENIIYRQDQGDHGNTVTSFLMDTQNVDRDERKGGFVVMMYFKNDGKTVEIETYATIQKQYFKAENQYTFEPKVDFLPTPEQVETEPPATEEVTEPATTPPETNTPETQAPPAGNSGGCGGVVGTPVVALIATVGCGFTLLRKKKH